MKSSDLPDNIISFKYCKNQNHKQGVTNFYKMKYIVEKIQYFQVKNGKNRVSIILKHFSQNFIFDNSSNFLYEFRKQYYYFNLFFLEYYTA